MRALGELHDAVSIHDDDGDKLLLRPYPGMERRRLQLVEVKIDADGKKTYDELVEDVKEMIYVNSKKELSDRGGIAGAMTMPLAKMEDVARSDMLSAIGLLMSDYGRSLEERL